MTCINYCITVCVYKTVVGILGWNEALQGISVVQQGSRVSKSPRPFTLRGHWHIFTAPALRIELKKFPQESCLSLLCLSLVSPPPFVKIDLRFFLHNTNKIVFSSAFCLI